ncbi:hypothetical protein P5673_011116 [Acropora cervicornis]|uniref:Uncharacterized protein n=1 Tax=Acropora cervicornis TaxID=6130 RepID=A0AAD9UY45_ACRCE|nr:hypothetical protein P5673_024290 [Acropora cervicornis]KAK2565187.1 hypothetical protein P5673_011116 [Acropora cervicornis]
MFSGHHSPQVSPMLTFSLSFFFDCLFMFCFFVSPQNKNGDMYTAAAFSAHMKSVLFGLTGKLASVNVLRSSFITWAYGKEDCTDAMKNSLAAALRHSRDQAQRTYDRRTANEKKNMAVGLARRCARGQLDSDSDRQTEDEQEEEEDQDTPSSNAASIKPGQLVGLVDDSSTSTQPRVWIGQVQSVANREASLLWYKKVAANTYKLELTGKDWQESLDSLVPVEMQAKKDASGTYKLLTSPRAIHRAVMDSH